MTWRMGECLPLVWHSVKLPLLFLGFLISGCLLARCVLSHLTLLKMSVFTYRFTWAFLCLAKIVDPHMYIKGSKERKPICKSYWQYTRPIKVLKIFIKIMPHIVHCRHVSITCSNHYFSGFLNCQLFLKMK